MPRARRLCVLPSCRWRLRFSPARAWAWLREPPPAAGWVVNLRGNGGGSRPYQYSAGEVRIGAHQLLVATDPPADTPELPVAVLINRRTASAAEGVLVAFQGRSRTRSFGVTTAAVPTGNVCHRLADGSLLAITESVAVDRSGRTYAGALPADDAGGLSTASAWLIAHAQRRRAAS